MPEKKTLERAEQDLKEGKSPSTAAGEFVKQEIDHIREGKHGARSTKQAIAIGLSEARRAGIPLPPPKSGSAATKKAAKRDSDIGSGKTKAKAPSKKRSAAAKKALKKEPRAAASKKELSQHAKQTAAAARKTRKQNAAKPGPSKKTVAKAVKRLDSAVKKKSKAR